MLALPLRGSTPELYHGKYVAGMFGSGEHGVWYDPSDLSTLYQDAVGTIPVTAVGQPVGKILDKSGRGNHATQATTASRPTLQQDTSGKYYLSFDGVDDWMVTGNINWSATDKMTVFAAVRKLANGFQVIAELGDPTKSPGTSSLLIVSSSISSGASYASIIRSPSGYHNEAFAGIGPYAAPIQSVVSVRLDRTKTTTIEEILIRHNAQNKSLIVVTDTNPSGNFDSFPLTIGMRGTLGPFNGRLYGLIVRGAATDDDHLTHAEKYLAYKSGVTL